LDYEHCKFKDVVMALILLGYSQNGIHKEIARRFPATANMDIRQLCGWLPLDHSQEANLVLPNVWVAFLHLAERALHNV
jgi:hypothetical protein